ncbi:unnamed protein product [Darwinula stevensoni]|uniref:C2H2-type domain-containing protein n=1 Tax=Darwinula stevensoni TaxID=69355 RepID=A0A7R8XD56_9CRUS|nr:unnamed protein product [Darwinula stevensoni]CAG0886458.1 unnamed protein product [Darwinula stevensoni]
MEACLITMEHQNITLAAFFVTAEALHFGVVAPHTTLEAVLCIISELPQGIQETLCPTLEAVLVIPEFPSPDFQRNRSDPGLRFRSRSPINRSEFHDSMDGGYANPEDRLYSPKVDIPPHEEEFFIQAQQERFMLEMEVERQRQRPQGSSLLVQQLDDTRSIREVRHRSTSPDFQYRTVIAGDFSEKVLITIHQDVPKKPIKDHDKSKVGESWSSSKSAFCPNCDAHFESNGEMQNHLQWCSTVKAKVAKKSPTPKSSKPRFEERHGSHEESRGPKKLIVELKPDLSKDYSQQDCHQHHEKLCSRSSQASKTGGKSTLKKGKPGKTEAKPGRSLVQSKHEETKKLTCDSKEGGSGNPRALFRNEKILPKEGCALQPSKEKQVLSTLSAKKYSSGEDLGRVDRSSSVSHRIIGASKEAELHGKAIADVQLQGRHDSKQPHGRLNDDPSGRRMNADKPHRIPGINKRLHNRPDLNKRALPPSVHGAEPAWKPVTPSDSLIPFREPFGLSDEAHHLGNTTFKHDYKQEEPAKSNTHKYKQEPQHLLEKSHLRVSHVKPEAMPRQPRTYEGRSVMKKSFNEAGLESRQRPPVVKLEEVSKYSRVYEPTSVTEPPFQIGEAWRPPFSKEGHTSTRIETIPLGSLPGVPLRKEAGRRSKIVTDPLLLPKEESYRNFEERQVMPQRSYIGDITGKVAHGRSGNWSTSSHHSSLETLSKEEEAKSIQCSYCQEVIHGPGNLLGRIYYNHLMKHVSSRGGQPLPELSHVLLCTLIEKIQEVILFGEWIETHQEAGILLSTEYPVLKRVLKPEIMGDDLRGRGHLAEFTEVGVAPPPQLEGSLGVNFMNLSNMEGQALNTCNSQKQPMDSRMMMAEKRKRIKKTRWEPEGEISGKTQVGKFNGPPPCKLQPDFSRRDRDRSMNRSSRNRSPFIDKPSEDKISQSPCTLQDDQLRDHSSHQANSVSRHGDTLSSGGCNSPLRNSGEDSCREQGQDHSSSRNGTITHHEDNCTTGNQGSLIDPSQDVHARGEQTPHISSDDKSSEFHSSQDDKLFHHGGDDHSSETHPLSMDPSQDEHSGGVHPQGLGVSNDDQSRDHNLSLDDQPLSQSESNAGRSHHSSLSHTSQASRDTFSAGKQSRDYNSLGDLSDQSLRENGFPNRVGNRIGLLGNHPSDVIHAARDGSRVGLLGNHPSPLANAPYGGNRVGLLGSHPSPRTRESQAVSSESRWKQNEKDAPPHLKDMKYQRSFAKNNVGKSMSNEPRTDVSPGIKKLPRHISEQQDREPQEISRKDHSSWSEREEAKVQSERQDSHRVSCSYCGKTFLTQHSKQLHLRVCTAKRTAMTKDQRKPEEKESKNSLAEAEDLHRQFDAIDAFLGSSNQQEQKTRSNATPISSATHQSMSGIGDYPGFTQAKGPDISPSIQTVSEISKLLEDFLSAFESVSIDLKLSSLMSNLKVIPLELTLSWLDWYDKIQQHKMGGSYAETEIHCSHCSKVFHGPQPQVGRIYFEHLLLHKAEKEVAQLAQPVSINVTAGGELTPMKLENSRANSQDTEFRTAQRDSTAQFSRSAFPKQVQSKPPYPGNRVYEYGHSWQSRNDQGYKDSQWSSTRSKPFVQGPFYPSASVRNPTAAVEYTDSTRTQSKYGLDPSSKESTARYDSSRSFPALKYAAPSSSSFSGHPGRDRHPDFAPRGVPVGVSKQEFPSSAVHKGSSLPANSRGALLHDSPRPQYGSNLYPKFESSYPNPPCPQYNQTPSSKFESSYPGISAPQYDRRPDPMPLSYPNPPQYKPIPSPKRDSPYPNHSRPQYNLTQSAKFESPHPDPSRPQYNPTPLSRIDSTYNDLSRPQYSQAPSAKFESSLRGPSRPQYRPTPVAASESFNRNLSRPQCGPIRYPYSNPYPEKEMFPKLFPEKQQVPSAAYSFGRELHRPQETSALRHQQWIHEERQALLSVRERQSNLGNTNQNLFQHRSQAFQAPSFREKMYPEDDAYDPSNPLPD